MLSVLMDSSALPNPNSDNLHYPERFRPPAVWHLGDRGTRNNLTRPRHLDLQCPGTAEMPAQKRIPMHGDTSRPLT